MWNVIYCIQNLVYDGLLSRIICERLCQISASEYHSITGRTGKEYKRKERSFWYKCYTL
jgi:hypothetical protein